jgi:hypothetical protein
LTNGNWHSRTLNFFRWFKDYYDSECHFQGPKWLFTRWLNEVNRHSITFSEGSHPKFARLSAHQLTSWYILKPYSVFPFKNCINFLILFIMLQHLVLPIFSWMHTINHHHNHKGINLNFQFSTPYSSS